MSTATDRTIVRFDVASTRAGDRLGAVRELRRSIGLAYREALRTPSLCWSALRGLRDCAGDDYVATPEPILVLGGFLSHPYCYAPLGRLLRSLGHQVHFDHAFNARAFQVHVAQLMDRVDQIADASGEVVRIIGHSLGGIHGMALLDARPDLVGQVIAVGSPIDGGTPWGALQRLAERVLRLESHEVQALRRRVPRYGDRITTIAAAHDGIAPPAACRIPGATNHLIAEIAGEDRALASHGGLVFMRAVLRIVLATIAEPLTFAEPVRDAS